MGNDEAALLRLWREKRGETGPEDLSGNLIVQLGLATEALNRRLVRGQHNTGQVITDVQRQVRHPALRWTAATLDARVVAGTPLDSYLEPRPLPFLQCRFHTPGPPPFSSMNSTPAVARRDSEKHFWVHLPSGPQKSKEK
jgi:hypothetical protein